MPRTPLAVKAVSTQEAARREAFIPSEEKAGPIEPCRPPPTHLSKSVKTDVVEYRLSQMTRDDENGPETPRAGRRVQGENRQISSDGAKQCHELLRGSMRRTTSHVCHD